MTVTVRIPTPLRTLTGGHDEVPAAGATLAAVLDDLETRHPGLKARLVDDKGVRRFINVYLGEEDVRFLQGLATPMVEGAVLSIVPAIAGGA
ncbi:MAG: MoaD/ThiS family protein [Polyangiaceae bacterium]